MRTRRLGFVALALTASCGAGAASPSALPPKGPPIRSPEGVVLEVNAPLPAPAAVSSARGVVALVEPIPDEAIRDVVFAYFDALRRRDKDAMRPIVAERAVRIDGARATYGDREGLITGQIFATGRDYGGISPADLANPDRMIRYALSDLAAANQKRPEPMMPLDVMVRLEMPEPRGAGDKLFEATILFVLRAENGKTRIVTVLEEAATP